MSLVVEEILIYVVTGLLCLVIVIVYLKKLKKKSAIIQKKVDLAKAEGKFEPNSLHPYIDLSLCIGSGACVAACPEKDILGIVNGKATVINATSCIGHGACFHACPVEAISLRIGTETRGVELPHVKPSYETNVPGIFIAGELGGMGLIKNSVEQGKQAIDNIVKSLKPTMEGALDLVIIGAGPAGISASLAAKKHKLNFLTLDQDTLGGTVFTFPRAKVVMTNPMDLPLYGKVKLVDTSKDELLALWKDALGKNNIIIQENSKVEQIERMENDSFRLRVANKEEINANHVLIAIGRRGTPRKLGVPGEQLQKVAYRLIESERLNNKNIMVVGGGDSAVESAMLLMEQNQVILSYRKDQFARIKEKNRQAITQAANSQKLQIMFSSTIKEIEQDHVLINHEDQVKTVDNDLVYIFIGGELPIKFLENAGIKIEKRFGHIMKKH